MFSPSIFPSDQEDELILAYDGNPESVGQKIYFHPATGSLVTSYDVGGKKVLANTGMTFEDVVQDLSAAGQGMQRFTTMWQYATSFTADKVCNIIENEVGLPFKVSTTVWNKPQNRTFPTNKPMRAITVKNTESGASLELNAGLEAQAFVAFLIVQKFGTPDVTCEYKASAKLTELRERLTAALQTS